MQPPRIHPLVLTTLLVLPAACADDTDANDDALGLGETEGDGDGDPMGDGDGDPGTGDGDPMGDGDGDPTGDGDGDPTGDGDGDNGMSEPDPDSVELPDPADYTYSAEHVFALTDLIGDFDGLTQAEDPTIVCLDCDPKIDGSVTMYPIDSAFGYTAIDFVGSAPRPRDGMYHEGWVGVVHDPDDGEPEGIALADEPTLAFRTGALGGSWCAGAGADLVKCSTEHYTVMEHILTCYESVPYMFFDPITGQPADPVWDACAALDNIFDVDPTTLDPYEYDLDQIAYTTDYSVTNKDDGKVLYRWGTWEKRPTDIRLTARIALPEEWKQPGANFKITRAELAIVHTVTNSPNDQIRPEDFENEAATGRKPAYEVLDDGRWVSTVDCYEGDGDLIPAGTTLRNPAFSDSEGLSADLVGGFTNAWYTTTDREPFEADPVSGVGPRWRLKSGKFGQDLPGVEIPAINCTPPPLKKGENKYTTGEAIATIINLLDWPADEESPLATSAGWLAPTLQTLSSEHEGVTINGLALSEDLDIAVYLKGDVKSARLYRAVLYLDYEPL